MTKENRKQIGSRLRAVRRQKGLTQKEVADSAGITSNYYARVERGDVSVSLERFKMITKALGVKTSDIADD